MKSILSRHLLNLKVLPTDFKGFEALHSTVLDINDELLCSNVRTEVGHMYDELRRSFETFQRHTNKLTFNVKHKKFKHS